MTRPDIAICGNGAAAVALFRALARNAREALAVTIVGSGKHLGDGIAYSTRNPAHVLNVPAHKMSADADEPEQFTEWLCRRGLDVSNWEDTFVRRELYGAYLSDLVERTRLEFRTKIRLELIQAEVVGLAQQQEGWNVFHTGGVLCADTVALATGHDQPQPLAAQFGPEVSQYIVDDPWAELAVEATARVLVVGTGLTAVDTALALLDRGHRGRIVMLSRHGLLPQTHVAHGVAAPLKPPFPSSTAALVRALRRAAGRKDSAEERQAFMDAMRPHWPAIWAALPDGEKRRALRHGLAHFNTHRHRIAPHQGRQLAEAVSDGRIEVMRGRLSGLAPLCNSVRAAVRTGAGERNFVFGHVVNCSGPNSDPERSPGTLLKTLIARHVARPGAAGLGIDVDEHSRVRGHDGRAQPNLFALGALTRGTWWEITAMPEIAAQAQRVAGSIAARRSRAPLEYAGHTILSR